MKYIYIFLFFVPNLVLANQYFATCKNQSESMNRSLPRQVDNITVLNATDCTVSRGRLYFQFYHTILNPKKLPKNMKKISKKKAKKTYCSRDYRKALNYWTYDFYYVDRNYKPLLSFSISKSDC